MLGTTYYFLVRSPHWFAGCLRRAGDGLSPLAACDARRLSTNLFLRSVDDLPAALRFAVLNGFLQFKLLAWVLIAEIRPAARARFPCLRNRQALEARDDAGNRRNVRQRDHDGLRSREPKESFRLKASRNVECDHENETRQQRIESARTNRRTTRRVTAEGEIMPLGRRKGLSQILRGLFDEVPREGRKNGGRGDAYQ